MTRFKKIRRLSMDLSKDPGGHCKVISDTAQLAYEKLSPARITVHNWDCVEETMRHDRELNDQRPCYRAGL